MKIQHTDGGEPILAASSEYNANQAHVPASHDEKVSFVVSREELQTLSNAYNISDENILSWQTLELSEEILRYDLDFSEVFYRNYYPVVSEDVGEIELVIRPSDMKLGRLVFTDIPQEVKISVDTNGYHLLGDSALLKPLLSSAAFLTNEYGKIDIHFDIDIHYASGVETHSQFLLIQEELGHHSYIFHHQSTGVVQLGQFHQVDIEKIFFGRERYEFIEEEEREELYPLPGEGYVVVHEDLFTLTDDDNTVVEDLTVVANGNVFANETESDGTDVIVSEVKDGNGVTHEVTPEGILIEGMYGDLFVQSDGSYSYLLNNGINGVAGDIQSLAQGEEIFEQFTFSYDHNSKMIEDTTLTMKILGTNDAPEISVESVPAVEAMVIGTKLISPNEFGPYIDYPVFEANTGEPLFPDQEVKEFVVPSGNKTIEVQLRDIGYAASITSLGYYFIDQEGIIHDPDILWGAINPVKRFEPTVEIDVPFGMEVGFFIIVNGGRDLTFDDSDVWQFVRSDNYDLPASVFDTENDAVLLHNGEFIHPFLVLHSVGGNLNRFDEVRTYFGLPPGEQDGYTIRVGFEDSHSAGAGDRDFEDAVFDVTLSKDPVLGPVLSIPPSFIASDLVISDIDHGASVSQAKVVVNTDFSGDILHLNDDRFTIAEDGQVFYLQEQDNPVSEGTATGVTLTYDTEGSMLLNGDAAMEIYEDILSNIMLINEDIAEGGLRSFTFQVWDEYGAMSEAITTSIDILVPNFLQGGNAVDVIEGMDGVNNVIFGYGGDDTLIAGDQENFLYGGEGADLFVLGEGNDKVSFFSLQDSIVGHEDLIQNFTQGEDIIDLTGIDEISGINDLTFEYDAAEGVTIVSYVGEEDIFVFKVDTANLTGNDFDFDI